MKRISMALASVGTALALTVGLAGSSYASADGVFLYTTAGGDQETLDNPSLDRCYNRAGDGHAVNQTNRTALVFRRAGCVGSAERIRPKQHAFDITFESVEFPS
ncbi:hypothetical protein ADK86_35860 [Streptomyces sp. NRRL F-5755]|uniref:hypothetical protein n=1 Tax=unclassified Streptomyces TaxID=2593676 RepID=UPI0006AD8B8A|nr:MULTISPECIES: hypothetical protein [unclassified Streptomyces]KOT87608.1 hypothetical protein ADK86_35860 [Streptomyces sp. NRRL F-5755]RSO09073.1 hypothetical protein DMH18_19970 [Streptomyces sp. WAC 06783]